MQASATCPTNSGSSLWGTYVTTQTRELTLPIGQKICYEASDVGNNKAYAESEPGVDTIAPTITVNPSSAHSAPKREITVTASSSDSDLDSTSWRYKNISGSATCNAAAMSVIYSLGSAVTLAHEAYNGDKILFRG